MKIEKVNKDLREHFDTHVVAGLQNQGMDDACFYVFAQVDGEPAMRGPAIVAAPGSTDARVNVSMDDLRAAGENLLGTA
ncbi:hypothetical protein [Aliirhizobium cellulosilyticum]|uniref:Uncharacterized protein n=1 Tax=Aliirhizobium cellulosilyticum TaxID=393664 RepID=A0A7W6WPF9_9HYPH|nr:hypothetical protein [Rhizobium cellulosilyticum]MBB4347930.1 hypothetical protein [Rhizobium cellulosilyticum]MBB4409676.1 hypothetical protein [Rhizobium cellulosilyticum]MBB4444363.1 hypothetical protein [Rhizobium cellulosilyticum]